MPWRVPLCGRCDAKRDWHTPLSEVCLHPPPPPPLPGPPPPVLLPLCASRLWSIFNAGFTVVGAKRGLLLHELAFRSGSDIVCWSVSELELFLFCFVGFVGFSCGRRDCIDSAVLPRAVCAVHWSSV